MTQSDLVSLIGDILTQLDVTLVNIGDPSTAEWQELYALRKHLDDQQRELVASTIESDDAGFAVAAGVIQTATDQLDEQIKAQDKIDAVIKIVSQVSANLDQVLKMAV